MNENSINWSLIIEEAKKAAVGYIREVRTAPDLRGIFYILVSKELIPNTDSYYRSLSKKLVRAREDCPKHTEEDQRQGR